MQLSELHSDLAEAAQCGMHVYSLNGSPRLTVLLQRVSDISLNVASSRGFVRDEDRQVVENGNIGIGKSWFQVYLLRHPLLERQDGLFDFVVRHVGRELYLVRLETGLGYDLKGDERERHILTLLDNPGRILLVLTPSGDLPNPSLCYSTITVHPFTASNPH